MDPEPQAKPASRESTSVNYSENEIKKIYDSLTSAKSRTVRLSQITRCLQLLSQCPTQDVIDEIYMKHSPATDGDNTNVNLDNVSLDLDQFAEILKNYSYTREERLDQLFKAFKYFDKEDSGVVSKEPMKTLLLTVGDCLSEKECSEFFKIANPGTDGKWPYDDFVTKMVDSYPRPQTKKKSAKKNSGK